MVRVARGRLPRRSNSGLPSALLRRILSDERCKSANSRWMRSARRSQSRSCIITVADNGQVGRLSYAEKQRRPPKGGRYKTYEHPRHLEANYGDAVYAGAGGGSGAAAGEEWCAAEFDPGERGSSADNGRVARRCRCSSGL